MGQGNHKAAISLGNHLIDCAPDRAEVMRMGLAGLPLAGDTGSWLMDICVYPEAPYDILCFLPHINRFLASPLPKVQLRALYSLQDMIVRSQAVCE